MADLIVQLQYQETKHQLRSEVPHTGRKRDTGVGGRRKPRKIENTESGPSTTTP